MFTIPRTVLITCAISSVSFSASALRHASVDQPHADVDSRLMSTVFRAAEKQSDDLEDGVLVFIPGTSDKRIWNVKKTIAWLQRQTVPTECIIYKYGELITPEEELSPCRIIDNPGGKWMDHVIQVPLNLTKKKYVFHVLDGLEIKNIDLARMIKAMTDNDLVHTAPALYGKVQFPQMRPHLGFGRKVKFIEYHIDLLTRENFACLQDLVDSKDSTNGTRVTNNHYGWGVAYAMIQACPGNLGVIDAFKMLKYDSGAYSYDSAGRAGWTWLHIEKKYNDSIKEIDPSPETPLKGDLLPDDPQCDGSMECVCEGAEGQGKIFEC